MALSHLRSIFRSQPLPSKPPCGPWLFLDKPWFGPINPEFEFIFLDGGNINGGVPFKTLTFVNDSSGIKIEQSCNGLLCCSSFRSNSIDRTYYIYNPSTKHYTVLPKSQLRKNGFVSVCSVSLAFDPLKSNHYEVVCIWRNDKDDYQIEIYYSKTATWRVSGYPFPASDGSLFSRPGVFWNGSLHWISLRESCDWTRLRESYVYFDTGRELLIKMPVPPIPNGEWDRRTIKYFGECNGHLHLIEIYGPVTSRFDILEMDIDYSLWTVKYRVDLEILSIAYPEMVRDDDADEEELDHFDFSILHVEEEEESSKLVLEIPYTVISHDLKELSYKEIHDLAPGFPAIQYGSIDALMLIST